MWQEWFKEFENMKEENKMYAVWFDRFDLIGTIEDLIEKEKKKMKILKEIRKTAKKYDLEVTRQDNKLIIKGIFE